MYVKGRKIRFQKSGINPIITVIHNQGIMKYIKSYIAISFTFILLGLTICNAQQINEDGTIEVMEIITREGESAESLFKTSKMFFVENFKSAKDVIELEDFEGKKIIGKGLSKLSINFGHGPDIETNMFYNINIESKEGRYRYSIDNIYYRSVVANARNAYPKDFFSKEAMNKDYGSKKVNAAMKTTSDNYRRETMRELKSIMKLIKEHMSKEGDDNW